MGLVSRETDRPTNAEVEQWFPHGFESIDRYVDLLTNTAVHRGLIGPREVPRLWQRHILNCVVVAPVFPTGSAICDLGSGAGLPGLILAISRPDLVITLAEPALRRTTFLTEVVAELELANVEVVRGRAEDLVGHRQFDGVTARAVAPLIRLAGWALPLCRPGGELVAIKGASAQRELEEAASALSALRAGPVTIERHGESATSTLTTVVRIVSSGYVPTEVKRFR